MRTTKALMLAAVTALSLGVGAAMAQESQESAGARPGPYEAMELKQMLARQAAAGNRSAEAAAHREPQYGSSDSANKTVWPVPVLQGGDGSGG
jgi:hypothetical protein